MSARRAVVTFWSVGIVVAGWRCWATLGELRRRWAGAAPAAP